MRNLKLGIKKGLKILRSRIYDLERQKIDDERSKERKSKIGSGDRSEELELIIFLKVELLIIE